MQIVSPFPSEQLPAAWAWLREFPSANFDDYSNMATFDEFVSEALDRFKRERSWAILKDDEYCGMVFYTPITGRLGAFHGVCFAQNHCSKEEKRSAMLRIVAELFGQGVEKICATFFADNVKIGQLLCDIGAVKEGYLKRHTIRYGVPIDMIQVAIFNPRA